MDQGIISEQQPQEDNFENSQSVSECEEIGRDEREGQGGSRPLLNSVTLGDGIPRVYRHLTCGETTELPDEIVQTNLIDPCYYNCFTFCSECGQNWHQSDFVWVDTQENLYAYQRRLFREKPASYRILYWATSSLGLTGFGALTGALVGLICGVNAGPPAAIGACIGFVLGLGPARHLRLAILKTRLVDG